MSLPVEHARVVVNSLRSKAIGNLIAQSKAKQVLREVRELPTNFPQFFEDLDDRVTFVAYALLAAGCSLVEHKEFAEGYSELHASADLLESAHRTETIHEVLSGFHCLVGAMAFYACGQYSRAFVLVKRVEHLTPAAGILASFLRKDTAHLIERLNAVLLNPEPDFEDTHLYDEWVLTVSLARSVSMIFEYSIAGNESLLAEAKAVLKDTMVIGESSSNPSFWWLARLLRLMLDDYSKSSFWNVLPPHFDPDGTTNVTNYVRLLALGTPPITELWKSQLSCLRLALDQRNLGGVINLRTSAGKTRVAELSILQMLKTDPSAKALYLAPFRSLAFELERTFTKFLSPLGYSVSHLYGGSSFSSVDFELFNEANVTIATPEKAKAMLRAAPEMFSTIKLVIIDEGHMLGGNERNVRNELFLEHLRILCRKNSARMLLLSAVLPNASDLASWIGGDANALVKSDWKPSAERFGLLRWLGNGATIEWLGEERCFNPHFVEFREVKKENGKGVRQFPSNKQEAVAAAAIRLAELGPVLIFAGQAQWVPSMTRGVLLAVGEEENRYPWPETEWKIFEAVCKEELGDDSLEYLAAKQGVICHSNKLPPQVRIAVERMMAKKAPRIIVATSTLGQGVNIGITSVIVATTYIGAQIQISKRDFWNICGRAGRAFVDGEGKILFAIDATRKAWQIRNDEQSAKNYLDVANLDKVESGLLQLVRTLRLTAMAANVSFEVLLELVANGEFKQLGEKQEGVSGLLDWIDDQILAFHLTYKGAEDEGQNADWIEKAFQESLAAIQEKALLKDKQEGELLRFLQARSVAVLKAVPSASARRAIVASGLPLSVALSAFAGLDTFRQWVDEYIAADATTEALLQLIGRVEQWSRESAATIVSDMPDQTLLDLIRPKWVSGVSLHSLIQQCGQDITKICTEFYGYQLPWIFHSVSQKLDKEAEEPRVNALAKAGMLVELGLPNEASAKVYLAGVRSRAAAVELGAFVRDPSASIRKLRNALLNPETVEAIKDSLSESTLEWLRLLSLAHASNENPPPTGIKFRLKAPDELHVLHVRSDAKGSIHLCSSNGRFHIEVKATEGLPLDKIANDPRFAFIRDGQDWTQECRDPRISQFIDLF